LCVQGSIKPEAARVEPLPEQGFDVGDENLCHLFSPEKCPVVVKRSRTLEMVSNLHLQKIAHEPFDAMALSPVFSFDHSAQLPSLQNRNLTSLFQLAPYSGSSAGSLLRKCGILKNQTHSSSKAFC
jgi:hypothetical protein